MMNPNNVRLPASVSATHAAPDVSEKYRFVSTVDCLEIFEKQGWVPVSSNQKRVRKEEHEGFQTHVVRLRRVEADGYPKVGDSLPEIVLMNAHNRGASFRVMAGMFRLVCSNGLIVSDSLFAEHRIRHTGFAVEKVLEAIQAVEESFPKVLARMVEFQGIALSSEDQVLFAEKACLLRWEEGSAPSPRALLAHKRYNDRGQSLWEVFNRIQDNMIRGVQKNLVTRATGNYWSKSIRATNGVQQQVAINQGLWQLAEDFAAKYTAENIPVAV